MSGIIDNKVAPSPNGAAIPLCPTRSGAPRPRRFASRRWRLPPRPRLRLRRPARCCAPEPTAASILPSPVPSPRWWSSRTRTGSVVTLARLQITVARSVIKLPVTTPITGARFAVPSVRAPVQCTDRSTGPGSGRCAARVYLSVQSAPGGTPFTTFRRAEDTSEKCTARFGDRHPDRFALPFRSLSRRDGSIPPLSPASISPSVPLPDFSFLTAPRRFLSHTRRTYGALPCKRVLDPHSPAILPPNPDRLMPEKVATIWWRRVRYLLGASNTLNLHDAQGPACAHSIRQPLADFQSAIRRNAGWYQNAPGQACAGP